jgi:hypothetical protein
VTTGFAIQNLMQTRWRQHWLNAVDVIKK